MANILKKVLHNTSSKSPQDLVSRTSAAADKLTETASERQQEELSKYLTYMKVQSKPFYYTCMPAIQARNSCHLFPVCPVMLSCVNSPLMLGCLLCHAHSLEESALPAGPPLRVHSYPLNPGLLEGCMQQSS